jgi:hypothetical protein
MMGEAMSESPSNYYLNKEFLLKLIMEKVGLTRDDLDKDHSFVKSKVRESKIDEILE